LCQRNGKLVLDSPCSDVAAQTILPRWHRNAFRVQLCLAENRECWPPHATGKLPSAYRPEVDLESHNFENLPCELVPRALPLGTEVVQAVALGANKMADRFSQVAGESRRQHLIIYHSDWISLGRFL